ncbi:MAG: site-specific integrase [Acidobacteria bacterium]|nr:site-specific integrase [Acidobacteriota bacterium]
MSVYKRGGVYWYEFVFQGQRIRESTGLANKTAALRAEAIHRAGLAEGRAGIVRHKSCPTLESFVKQEFLPWCKKEHESHPRTYVRYETGTRPLLAAFGKLRLDMISSGHVEKFKVSRGNDISPGGVNRELAILRLMLNLAIRQEYITRNPVCGVRFLREGPGCMRIVSHEEEQRYLKAAHPTLWDVATMIIETGMCPEEVFTICKENVHLSKKYLFVPHGKTIFRRRNVPLTDRSMEVLKRRLAACKGTYLFPHRLDSERPMTDVHHKHHHAVRDAKIRPRFRLYDLRHTFGSRMAMAGVDLATLKELMGHSTITTTMRYVHPTPEHKRAAVDKLERFNVEQLFRVYDSQQESPQKSPQSPTSYSGQPS